MCAGLDFLVAGYHIFVVVFRMALKNSSVTEVKMVHGGEAFFLQLLDLGH